MNETQTNNVNQGEKGQSEKPVNYLAGPFTVNRKSNRATLSKWAARHKRIKAFTMGFRSYTHHRGNIIWNTEDV